MKRTSAMGPWIAVGCNAVACLGCAALAAMAPDRSGVLLAGAALAFFGFMTFVFTKMARLRVGRHR